MMLTLARATFYIAEQNKSTELQFLLQTQAQMRRATVRLPHDKGYQLKKDVKKDIFRKRSSNFSDTTCSSLAELA